MMSSDDTGGSIIGRRRSVTEMAAELSSLGASPFYKTRLLILADTPTKGRLGDYHIISKHQSPASEVYVCLRDIDVPQPPVALKTFRSEFTFDPIARRAFKRECAVWARASLAPGILPIWGLEEIDGRTFISMPGALPGPRGEITLKDLIDRGLPPLKMIVFFARLIAASLTAAARAVPGLVHGDLKPSNMLIMWGNVPMISDFGVARAAAHSVRGDALSGTPAYCSPLARDPTAELSVLDDIYSYGVILEELLTGSRRKSGRTKKGRNASTGSSVRSVQVNLLALARQCRAQSPSERPNDFSVILDMLDQIAPEDQWPVPDQIDTIPNPIASPYRIKSVALTLIMLEEYGSALEFIAGTNSKTRPWELWMYQGIAFSSIDKPARARASLRQARVTREVQNTETERRPQELDLITYFFAAAHRQDRSRKAVKLLRQLAFGSADSEIAMSATYSLAAIYTEMRRFKEAEWLLQKVRTGTEEALVWNQLGTVYIRLQEFELAVAAYQRALQLAPLNPLYYNSLGQALLCTPDRAEEALRTFNRAIDSGDLSQQTLIYALVAAYVVNDRAEILRLNFLIVSHVGREAATLNRINDRAVNTATRLKNGTMPKYRRARSDVRWERRNSFGTRPIN